MEAQIRAQGKRNPPVLGDIKQPIVDLSANPNIMFVVVEGGMSSGEPSVLIVSQSHDCSVVLQTSLDKFVMGANGMMGMAESRWGWKRPEGYATIMPDLSREKRKEILESIKKELEEWGEVDDGQED